MRASTQFFIIGALFIGSPVIAVAPPGGLVPLIFDTDIGNDIDDALALGMIHALVTRREVELLAVTITKDNALAAPFADAINTFYGRGRISIGVTDSGITRDTGLFLPLAETKDDDVYRYPHDLVDGQDAPDAVSVLRSARTRIADVAVAIAVAGEDRFDLYVDRSYSHHLLRWVEIGASDPLTRAS